MVYFVDLQHRSLHQPLTHLSSRNASPPRLKLAFLLQGRSIEYRSFVFFASAHRGQRVAEQQWFGLTQPRCTKAQSVIASPMSLVQTITASSAPISVGTTSIMSSQHPNSASTATNSVLAPLQASTSSNVPITPSKARKQAQAQRTRLVAVSILS